MSTSWSAVTGVILAAGRGTRMRELGMELPKPLLPICNMPLIALHLRSMRDLGIKRVVVVIGHLGAMVVNYLSAHRVPGVEITYVEQASQLGIAHAVGRLEQHVDGPILLVLGDIFFAAREMHAMLDKLATDADGAVLAVREDSVDAVRKNYTVELTPDGLVRRVIEKPRVVRTLLKGCGIYLFSPAIFDAIRKTPRTAGRDEYEITDSIQILIDSGLAVRVANVIDRDINITFPGDLLECNIFQLRVMGKDLLVGRDATLHPGARLGSCIVGDHTEIGAAAEADECLFLAGAHLDQPIRLRRAVVTPTQIVQC
jgi:dTDP-glucose pyrophosphorylase